MFLENWLASSGALNSLEKEDWKKINQGLQKGFHP